MVMTDLRISLPAPLRVGVRVEVSDMRNLMKAGCGILEFYKSWVASMLIGGQMNCSMLTWGPSHCYPLEFANDPNSARDDLDTALVR